MLCVVSMVTTIVVSTDLGASTLECMTVAKNFTVVTIFLS
jgi:hypothetical protein